MRTRAKARNAGCYPGGAVQPPRGSGQGGWEECEQSRRDRIPPGRAGRGSQQAIPDGRGPDGSCRISPAAPASKARDVRDPVHRRASSPEDQFNDRDYDVSRKCKTADQGRAQEARELRVGANVVLGRRHLYSTRERWPALPHDSPREAWTSGPAPPTEEEDRRHALSARVPVTYQSSRRKSRWARGAPGLPIIRTGWSPAGIRDSSRSLVTANPA